MFLIFVVLLRKSFLVATGPEMYPKSNISDKCPEAPPRTYIAIGSMWTFFSIKLKLFLEVLDLWE